MERHYYNVTKPKPSTLHPVGHKVEFASKTSQGSYIVIGHVNCDRCNTVLEQREWIEPRLKDRKKGYYYQETIWCYECGLWQPNKNSKKFITNQ